MFKPARAEPGEESRQRLVAQDAVDQESSSATASAGRRQWPPGCRTTAPTASAEHRPQVPKHLPAISEQLSHSLVARGSFTHAASGAGTLHDGRLQTDATCSGDGEQSVCPMTLTRTGRFQIMRQLQVRGEVARLPRNRHRQREGPLPCEIYSGDADSVVPWDAMVQLGKRTAPRKAAGDRRASSTISPHSR